MNADQSLIAVGLEHDIHIFNTDSNNLTLCQVLNGHISHIDALSFHPKDSRRVVSYAKNHQGGTVPIKPTIVLWDLDDQRPHELL